MSRMILVPDPNFKKLAKKVITKRELLEIAIDITTEIRDRTIQGVDYLGRKFKPYTEEYAKSKGVNRNDVTLLGNTAGTRMLNNIKQKADNNTAVLYFADSEKNDIAVKNMKTRKFFEFSEKDERKIKEYYEKKLEKNIKGWERE